MTVSVSRVNHRPAGTTAAVHNPLPSWVIRDRNGQGRCLYLSASPRKRPSADKSQSVVKGHEETHAPQHDRRSTNRKTASRGGLPEIRSTTSGRDSCAVKIILDDPDQTKFPIGAQGTAAIYTGGERGAWAALRKISIRSHSWLNWLYPLSS